MWECLALAIEKKDQRVKAGAHRGLASLGDSGEIGYTLTLSIGETQIHPQVGFEVRMRRIGGREKAQRSSLNLPHHS